MGESRNGRAHECVAVDLNTQYDFCDSSGSSFVDNADIVLPALRRVVAWVKRNQVPVVSAIDSQRASEIPTYEYASRCVDGTVGQRKLEFTVFPQHTYIEIDNTLSVPLNLFESCQQLIFRKRTRDLLANPKADRFLTQVPALEFLVFGNTLEVSIRSLVLGLRARHKAVTVIVDACGYWNHANAELALRQMCAKGAQITSVSELQARKLNRKHRYACAPKNGRVPLATPSGIGAKRANRRITKRFADGWLPRPAAPNTIRARNIRANHGGIEG